MKGIEILSAKDLEYFHQKAKEDSNVNIIKISAAELLSLDVQKYLDCSSKESNNQIEAELVEWIEANRKKLKEESSEANRLISKENGKLENSAPPFLKIEDILSNIESEKVRKMVMEAIDAGLSIKELKVIIQ